MLRSALVPFPASLLLLLLPMLRDGPRRIAGVGLLTMLLAGLAASVAAAEDAPSPAEQPVANAPAEPTKGSVVGTPARPIDQCPPEYPETARKKGQEGWVIVSYVVQADGSVADAMIEDSSGVPDFKTAALEAISAWRFEPATLAGKPTEECHAGLLLPFSVDSGRGSGRGASSSFTKKYRRVMKKRDKGDTEDAARMTAELAAEEDLNLYEAASVEILLSLVSRDQGDARAELRHLERAGVNHGEFLDEDAREALLFRMFALQVELGRYADALATYDALETARGRKGVPEPVENVVTKIRGVQQGDRDFAVTAIVGEANPRYDGRGRFDHALLRRMFGFASDTMEDDLQEYELRCDFSRVKGTPHPDRAIRIPEAWGSCRLYVYGSPGSEFKLIEYAESAH